MYKTKRSVAITSLFYSLHKNMYTENMLVIYFIVSLYIPNPSTYYQILVISIKIQFARYSSL